MGGARDMNEEEKELVARERAARVDRQVQREERSTHPQEYQDHKPSYHLRKLAQEYIDHAAVLGIVADALDRGLPPTHEAEVTRMMLKNWPKV